MCVFFPTFHIFPTYIATALVLQLFLLRCFGFPLLSVCMAPRVFPLCGSLSFYLPGLDSRPFRSPIHSCGWVFPQRLGEMYASPTSACLVLCFSFLPNFVSLTRDCGHFPFDVWQVAVVPVQGVFLGTISSPGGSGMRSLPLVSRVGRWLSSSQPGTFFSLYILVFRLLWFPFPQSLLFFLLHPVS